MGSMMGNRLKKTSSMSDISKDKVSHRLSTNTFGEGAGVEMVKRLAEIQQLIGGLKRTEVHTIPL